MEEIEFVQRWMNPPLVASREMAKVIQVKLTKPGQVLEMKVDNRYKDGNVQIVKGIVRGNKNTIALDYASPPNNDKGVI